MKLEDFKVGMRVMMHDEDDDKTFYGRVTDIPDQGVVIHWDDLSEPTEHDEDEFPLISPSNA